ncbi:CRISPR-associated endonuclease Cas1 [Phenylobacterium sp.]|uniref:CRISPR-associated endonuclease Cas1 n=1 Tax=Phenylobacterium sp. TaxID=1871053 RepID=UPI003BA9E6CB
MLDGSGSISFDVLTWLSEQNMPLVRLDYQGGVVSVIGGSGFAMQPEKLLWQFETRNDPTRRLEFSRQLIREKLTGTLTTLREVIPSRRERDLAVAKAETTIVRIDAGHFSSVDELRIAEATCAASYFSAWQGLPLRWRQKIKHPIPDDWLTIGPRNTLGKKGRYLSNRNARHPVNAVLNYAYGMLRSQVHIEAVAAGFDPGRGVMHHDRDDGDAFAWVFDMIEPRRAEVDAKVLKFMLDTPLKGADFVIRSDGVCRLVPQLARRVAELATP